MFRFALIAVAVLVTTPVCVSAEIADTTLAISSTTLGETREIRVALPEDYYRTTGRYPVLVVLDADWHFQAAVAAVRMLAETSYIQAHRIPPLIVVGIDRHDRDHDHTPTYCVSQHGMSFPTSGGADDFLVFMRDEMMPAIDAGFRTEPYRILAGWSLGGLLAMYALLEHPDVFGGCLAISPSLWWDDGLLVKRAAEMAADGTVRERDLVITIGSAEEGGLCYNAVHDLVDRWEKTPVSGLSFSFLEIGGEDHNHSPFKAYFDGVRALFADWFYPEAAFEAGLDSLTTHYAALSARRGYPIDVPDHIFNALSMTYLADGRPADAIAVARAKCDRDPTAIAYFHLGETCRKAGNPAAARDAYRAALDLEHRASAPDTVFIGYVSRLIDGLQGDG